MEALTAEEIYERHVRLLPPGERLRLLALTAQDLAMQSDPTATAGKRSVMELHGLGKEIWQGVDAQEYVDRLRSEWDRRP